MNIQNLAIPQQIFELINVPSPKQILSKLYKIMLQSEKTLSLPYHRWESDSFISANAGFWTHL